MADQLSVTCVQVASTLDPDENRARLDGLVGSASGQLVVLPEAFARDFGTAAADLSATAEPQDGPFGAEVERVAQHHQRTVIAGMFEASKDPSRPWNTLLIRGEVRTAYRKIHLYDSFGYRESALLTGGEEPVVVELHGWRLGVMTCYDLRFPELSRALLGAGAHVLVVAAAWVAGPRKVDHWRTLVRARAIENTAYVVATGQPAPRYCGHSLIVDPMGEVLAEAGEGEGAIDAVLSEETLTRAREVNPSLRNRRM